jgi:Peptidase family M28
LTEHPARRRTVRLLIVALACGAAIAFLTGLFSCAMTGIDVQRLAPTSALGKQLRAHVEYLASPQLKGRKPGTPGNRLAANYVADRFHEVGLSMLPSLGGYGHLLTNNLGANIVGARLPAGKAPEAWIVIGAHYDHLGESGGKIYAGADDNASAVGILIEVARRLPPPSHHGVLFISFNAEEAPYIRTGLMGSQQFLDRLPEEVGTPSKLKSVIIMDLMGGAHWLPLEHTVFAAGAEKTPALYARLKDPATDVPGLVVTSLGMHLIEEVPVVGHMPVSDYDAFRNAGVPHLFLSSGRTPRYHQPTDLPDTLHYERMAATVEWLIRLVNAIDKDPAPYAFEKDRLEVRDDIAGLMPLVAKASQWDTRIPGTSPISLLRLKQDYGWLEDLDVEAALRNDRDGTLKKLEAISIRMQCLLANFYGCAFF